MRNWLSLTSKQKLSQRRHGHIAVGERIYAIGDIHGRFDLLIRLLSIIAADQASRPLCATKLIVLGDVIDRGRESARVVANLQRWTRVPDRFVVLKGNHEALMSRALLGDVQAFLGWLKLGGDATLESWGLDISKATTTSLNEFLQEARRVIGSETLGWLQALPLTHVSGGVLFVHAGIRPGVPLDRQTESDLTGIRGDFIKSDASHPFQVVHGHTIVHLPVITPQRISIDTGAYETGRLTAVGLEADQCWLLTTATD